MSYGIDLNLWSGFLGMSQFQKDFGKYDSMADTYYLPTTWQSIASGTPIAGIAVGALLAGFIGSRLGRVKSLWIAAGIAIAGILLQSTAMTSFWQLVVGRIVNAFSMGIICK